MSGNFITLATTHLLWVLFFCFSDSTLFDLTLRLKLKVSGIRKIIGLFHLILPLKNFILLTQKLKKEDRKWDSK